MLGFITTRDLVFHGPLIVHEFGVTCYLRCLRRTLFSGRQVTFLECVPGVTSTSGRLEFETTGALLSDD